MQKIHLTVAIESKKAVSVIKNKWIIIVVIVVVLAGAAAVAAVLLRPGHGSYANAWFV